MFHVLAVAINILAVVLNGYCYYKYREVINGIMFIACSIVLLSLL